MRKSVKLVGEAFVWAYLLFFFAYMGVFIVAQHNNPLAFMVVEGNPHAVVTVGAYNYSASYINSVPPHPVLSWSWVFWVLGIPALAWRVFTAWPTIKKFWKNLNS